MRPAVGGVEIAVRYVTRASERYAMRARLYQAAVQLLADETGDVTAVTMPALFLGHGSPLNALRENTWTRAWGRSGARCRRRGRSSRSRRTGTSPLAR